jgi:hypothetical protein
MPDTTKNSVDGALSLDEQKNALNFHQQQHRCKVVDYQKDPASAVAQNIAACQQLPLGDPIPNLRLVIVQGTVPPGATFNNNVFVSSTVTHIAGLHS